MQRRVFHAMGTTVELLLDRTPDSESRLALADAEDEFERLEAALSRFRPDSELSELNRAGALKAGPELLEVTTLALEAREQTRGRFDPTVHDALVAAGYDRSFEQVARDGPTRAAPAACGGDVLVEGETIRLENGTRLDLGGIGKGYAVERAAELLSTAGPCLVNAGGDLAARGASWPIGVETADDVLTVALEDGAMATSGRDRRRWRRGGIEHHHIIDPSTGRPAASDLVRATVVAPTAVEAEVLAKVLFVAGERGALDTARNGEIAAVLVTADGRTILTGGLA
jgi:FAD:protein FMN transferase